MLVICWLCDSGHFEGTWKLWSMVVTRKLVDFTNCTVCFLQKFQTDVVVDLVCYRRHGHNEQVRLVILSSVFLAPVAPQYLFSQCWHSSILLVLRFFLDWTDLLADWLQCWRVHYWMFQDDPRATQPLTYQKILSHPTTLEIYSQKLLQEGIITQDVCPFTLTFVLAVLDQKPSLFNSLSKHVKLTFRANWIL